MKVKFEINGQTFEKEIDPSTPVTINMSTNSCNERNTDPHREVSRFLKTTNAFGTSHDEIERTVIRDDDGNVVDVIDRNLSREFRQEQRELDKIKKKCEAEKRFKESAENWKNTPLWIKILLFLIILSSIAFCVYVQYYPIEVDY